MQIDIVCVGKLKEKYYREAQEHYKKLLSRFAKVNIIEVADISLDGVKSEKEIQKIREKECAAALKHLQGYVIACDMAGRKFSSQEFSEFIQTQALKTGRFTVIIGGSAGLSDEAKKSADAIVSFSDMTMPHRLFRIVLLEQIFRAFKIAAGETYHK